jgi:hypothetical protein
MGKITMRLAMFSLVFSLIIGPAILAFLLGLSAHGLKKMTSSVELPPSSGEPDSQTAALPSTKTETAEVSSLA